MSLADALRKQRAGAKAAELSSSSSNLNDSGTWRRVREQHRGLLDVAELSARRSKSPAKSEPAAEAEAAHKEEEEARRASVTFENGYTKADLDALFGH